MKTYLKTLLFAALLCLTCYSFGQEQKPEASYVEDELIIWLEPGVDASSFAAHSNVGIEPKQLLSKRLNIWLFELVNSKEAREERMHRLAEHADVRVVQNNHTNIVLRDVIPDDLFYDRQWAPAVMNLPRAWEEFTMGGITATGDTIVAAVIDGGAYLEHVDMDFWKNYHEIPNNGIDDDGNGYVDDYNGWNALMNNGSVDNSSHGAHVSGIIGAIGNNATGVCGVNWNVKIMPIVGSYSLESLVVVAYSYVLEMRARYNETDGTEGAYVVVTNSSFGVDYGHPEDYPIWSSMYDEMGNVGILSCVAGPNLNVNVDEVGDMPSTCPSDYVIGVTNTTSSDVKYNAAGYGVESIDVGAPGTGIYSTLPNNGYGNMTGTSMATPQVTGTVALMYAAMNEEMMQSCKNDPANFCLMVRQALLDGADVLPSLDGLVAEGRRLNAYGAIETLLLPWIVPALEGEVTIVGQPVCGQNLSLETNLSSTPALPELGELSYQWLRDTVAIEGAVYQTYTLVEADINAMISVQVSAENCSGTLTSPAVGPVASPTEVPENRSQALIVYPNPTNGIFTVAGARNVTVFNALGQVVATSRSDNGTHTFTLPSGVYFIKADEMVKKVVVE
ncbi:MAG: S8 family peptidase [Bacteroidales bacterium]|nr:S8 family peptidase [Bacteroidales bacterium]